MSTRPFERADSKPSSPSGLAGPSARHGEPPAQDGRPDIEAAVRDSLMTHIERCPYLPTGLADALAAEVEATPLPDRRPNSYLGGKAACFAMLREIEALSADLREVLVGEHQLPAPLADEITKHGRERAITVALIPGRDDEDLSILAQDLAAREALGPTLLLRALCLGHLAFFEIALATLGATTEDRVRRLLYQDGAAGFMAVYELADLPLTLYRAFRAAIETVRRHGRERATDWHPALTEEIIASLVKEYDQVCPEDIEHVLSQLSRRALENEAFAKPAHRATA